MCCHVGFAVLPHVAPVGFYLRKTHQRIRPHKHDACGAEKQHICDAQILSSF